MSEHIQDLLRSIEIVNDQLVWVNPPARNLRPGDLVGQLKNKKRIIYFRSVRYDYEQILKLKTPKKPINQGIIRFNTLRLLQPFHNLSCKCPFCNPLFNGWDF